jgi:FkbM family methyltransferase
MSRLEMIVAVIALAMTGFGIVVARTLSRLEATQRTTETMLLSRLAGVDAVAAATKTQLEKLHQIIADIAPASVHMTTVVPGPAAGLEMPPASVSVPPASVSVPSASVPSGQVLAHETDTSSDMVKLSSAIRWLGNAAHDTATLKSQLADFTANVTVLQTLARETADGVKVVSTDGDWLKKQVASVEGQVASVGSQMASVEGQVASVVGTIETLRQTTSHSTAQLAVQLRENETLKVEIKQYEAIVKTLSLEVERLSQLVTDLVPRVSGASEPRLLAADIELMRRDINHTLLQKQPVLREGAPIERISTGADAAELAILAELAALCTAKSMVDIGAHRGHVSSVFLDKGFRVTAVEANPDVARGLKDTLTSQPAFTLVEAAAGAADGRVKLYRMRGADNGGEIDTQLSSVHQHPIYDGLKVHDAVDVPLVTVATLVAQGLIAKQLGFLKTDTEGNDLAVLKGMGDLKPEVICIEFWNRDFVFNGGKIENDLPDYLAHFSGTPYRWHAELYRREDPTRARLRVQTSGTLSRSWGNAYFFRDEGQFNAFVAACSAILGQDAVEYV